ncbi:MAG: ATP synthase F0 subunit C [Defluviitaleaceae bacterium]|nr:ATP synthase F0 subunit C [Defluviitaleaceae bacterium]
MLDPFAFVIAAAQFSAAIALLNGIMTTIGQGNVASHAIEAMARQPESAKQVQAPMFIGLAFAETSGVYGLLIAIILLFANPLVGLYMQYM